MKKITTITLFFAVFGINLCNHCCAQYTKLFDFDTINGIDPTGTLISDGTFLYGTAKAGGTNSVGTIFKILPDGTGYSSLHDFDFTNGNSPSGSLISVGTFLYGMTYGGGTSVDGTVFKIKSDGTGYSVLYNFAGTTSGKNPAGALISDGTFLYGMTNKGGTGACTGGCGVIFKIMPDGTGYSKLLDFTGTTNGKNPYGSLIFDGTFLYGMTTGGGTNDFGTIFKIMPDGTGYSKLLDFTGSNGKNPFGSLLSNGTFLYGTTYLGGTNGLGVVFKIKTDGTGYAHLLDFAGTTNGSSSYCTLISVGSFLYGTTLGGGLNNEGTLFKIMSDGTGYSKLYDWVGFSSASIPLGALLSDGNFLYGTTEIGGTKNIGTIFKYALITGITENNPGASFDIYPNPSNGNFTIVTKENDYALIITNVLGETIYRNEMKNQKSEIDLSKQQKGIYFAKIYYEGKIHLEKIVVQ